MKSERPGAPVPFDEKKLQLVREFLRRQFRGCQHRDYFEFDKTAQVFLIETDRNVRHKLAIPKGTFEDADFVLLLSRQLVAALETAGSLRVTLTPQGPRSLAAESNTIGYESTQGRRDPASQERAPSGRFLTWRRGTDRARAALVRYPLVYGAAMLLLGVGACVLVSSLGESHDLRQRVPERQLAAGERDATPAQQPRFAVPSSPASATVMERARPGERPAEAERRTRSTERPTPRASPVKNPPAGPVDALRRLVGNISPEVPLGKAMVRWVKAQPPPDPDARRREPEIPQSR